MHPSVRGVVGSVAKGAVIATAVAGLFACPSHNNSTKSATSDAAQTVRCSGINSCKGQGACSGNGHSCAGQNSCKGKGWISTTKAACKAKGGKVITG